MMSETVGIDIHEIETADFSEAGRILIVLLHRLGYTTGRSNNLL